MTMFGGLMFGFDIYIISGSMYCKLLGGIIIS